MHTLRDQEVAEDGDPMARHENLRRLYGAVSMEERRQRLGQYYTVLWNAEAGVEKEVRFEYQQGKTASRIKTLRREIARGTASGKEQFAVVGDDYFDNGRVLAWRISLLADGAKVASEQSYLWE